MKKICIGIFIVLFLIINRCYATTDKLVPYNPTKEDLKGEIDIPNREGSRDTYTDINTYEDLYSVLEDLSFNYNKLLEEYYEMEDNYKETIEEKNREIEELKIEIENIEITEKETINNESNVIIIAGIITICLMIWYFNKKQNN